MSTETTRTVPVRGGFLDVRTRGGLGGTGPGGPGPAAPADTGAPTLVFLHYWGGSAATWDAVVERLPATRRTVRYDQRGWGAARELPGPHDLDALADDLAAVVTALGTRRYVLVGHSMGGKVAQLLAARRPSGLAGLVLVAPAPPEPPAHVTEEYRQALAHAYDSAQDVGTPLDHVLTAAPLPEPVRAGVVRDSLAAGTQARREWPLRGIARNVTDAARRIDVPVTVLAGERDQVEPPHVLRDHLLPYIPHARLDVVPGAGHLLPLEAPDAVAASLRVLTGERAEVGEVGA
ncbi:alpha/beta hydrolase [Streptomyces sp. PTM05]|uniref:Alpha/beta hydrolase n=1 Tax=Streptantibioticus parmotrematis TaxID=2873249 RepID=A0ABS7QV56_9ACTN|nr:alpha/beta fold hydrolase [Streptantibioticus parmotrematis]MBY8887075.1 alpha/beta hydrolase [Streptantibioticus parmotrematis]